MTDPNADLEAERFAAMDVEDEIASAADEAPRGPFPRDVTGQPAPTADEVREAMEDVFDPELGVNVVDLGLVYDVELEGEDDRDAVLHMTLTSAACPLTDQIEDDTAAALQHVPGVRSYRINWVWQPSWSPEMMTPAGRMQMQAMGFNV